MRIEESARETQGERRGQCYNHPNWPLNCMFSGQSSFRDSASNNMLIFILPWLCCSYSGARRGGGGDCCYHRERLRGGLCMIMQKITFNHLSWPGFYFYRSTALWRSTSYLRRPRIWRCSALPPSPPPSDMNMIWTEWSGISGSVLSLGSVSCWLSVVSLTDTLVCTVVIAPFLPFVMCWLLIRWNNIVGRAVRVPWIVQFLNVADLPISSQLWLNGE